MKLMTKEIIEKFPDWGSTDPQTPDKIPVVVKYFNPTGAGTWYIIEFDGVDTMYGLCCIHEPELGYVALSELEGFKGPLGLGIERDLYFNGTLYDAMKREKYPHAEAMMKKDHVYG